MYLSDSCQNILSLVICLNASDLSRKDKGRMQKGHLSSFKFCKLTEDEQLLTKIQIKQVKKRIKHIGKTKFRRFGSQVLKCTEYNRKVVIELLDIV